MTVCLGIRLFFSGDKDEEKVKLFTYYEWKIFGRCRSIPEPIELRPWRGRQTLLVRRSGKVEPVLRLPTRQVRRGPRPWLALAPSLHSQSPPQPMLVLKPTRLVYRRGEESGSWTSEGSKGKRTRWRWWILCVLLLLIFLVSVGIGAYVLYLYLHPSPSIDISLITPPPHLSLHQIGLLQKDCQGFR